jgi:DNA-binding NarL/FixJ family response regulator
LALPHTHSREKIDTLRQLLDLAGHWVTRASAYSMLSQHYLWLGDTSMALRQASLCLKTTEDHPGGFYAALALGTLGTAEVAAGSPERAVTPLEAAVNLLEDLHHVMGLCDFLLPLARAYQMLDQPENAVPTLMQALRLQVDMDLNQYVSEKSIAWMAWTFVICADYDLDTAIQGGARIIIEERRGQPKHLRDRCAAVVAKSHKRSRHEQALSRKEWVQSVLRDLEARPQASYPRFMIGTRPGPTLTPREVDVLNALGEGLRNIAIARKMHVSESTVRTYLSHVYSKLGVSSRTAAIVRARELGMIEG